jgi:F-type H+-transporting ATPase subunit gamma
MKTLAALNIRQYEEAVRALDDYYRTVELGLATCMRQIGGGRIGLGNHEREPLLTIAVVFGSDQGLVGKFNDQLAETVISRLRSLDTTSSILSIGERIEVRLQDAGLASESLFAVPNSVNAITPLVGELLSSVERLREKRPAIELCLFYNSPVSGELYRPVTKRLLPLDEAWEKEIRRSVGPWPTKAIPELLCGLDTTQWALLREYLFVSLFRACAESLASENASRLSAMQRAGKNIDEMMEELTRLYHERRQARIDEELFDVVSGFQALGGDG